MHDLKQNTAPPAAMMLLGTHCPHCPSVLNSLSELVKQGVLSSLEVINLEQRPDIAEQLGVRSVPWVKIGQFELTGLRSKTELQSWAEKAGSEQGYSEYFEELLGEGKVQQVLDMIKNNKDLLIAVTGIIGDPEAKINARLGAGVIMEEYEGRQELMMLVPELVKLTRHADARVRSDACHYLSFTHDESVMESIELLLNDENKEVREVAQESLDVLKDGY